MLNVVDVETVITLLIPNKVTRSSEAVSVRKNAPAHATLHDLILQPDIVHACMDVRKYTFHKVTSKVSLYYQYTYMYMHVYAYSIR